MEVIRKAGPAAALPAFLAGVSILLAGCALGSRSAAGPPDVITPQAANAIAGPYVAQRIKALKSDDIVALRGNETGPMESIDLQLAMGYAATQETLRAHGQASGVIEFKESAVSRVDSYVPHQSSYPASFLSLVHLQDGSNSLLGFTKQKSSEDWFLTVAADVPDASGFKLSKARDGFAPQPKKFPYPNQGFIPMQLIFDLGQRCAVNPQCTLRGQPPAAPDGYRPGILSGKLVDDHIAQVVKSEQQYRSSGFTTLWGPTALPLVSMFPWYQLSSGGFFGFVWEAETLGVSAGSQSFRLDYQGQFINALLPAGNYKSNQEFDESLLAVVGPVDPKSGSFTAVGAVTAVVGDSPVTQGC